MRFTVQSDNNRGKGGGGGATVSKTVTVTVSDRSFYPNWTCPARELPGESFEVSLDMKELGR